MSQRKPELIVALAAALLSGLLAGVFGLVGVKVGENAANRTEARKEKQAERVALILLDEDLRRSGGNVGDALRAGPPYARHFLPLSIATWNENKAEVAAALPHLKFIDLALTYEAFAIANATPQFYRRGPQARENTRAIEGDISLARRVTIAGLDKLGVNHSGK